MIRAVFIDDEPLALKLMEMYAGKIPGMEVIASHTSAISAAGSIDRADVVFTDINMPDLNGLDFIKGLKNPPLVVFTTAYPQFAVESFKVEAVDYLLKPFSFTEFDNAVRKVSERMRMLRAVRSQEGGSGELVFKADYRTVRVVLDEIIYVESMGGYVKIWREGQETPLVVYYSLRKLENELPPERFMRIHKSYLIALDKIVSASKVSVTLKGCLDIPIGEAYRASFCARYHVRVSG